ncbi:MAG: Lrp/AsnC family transcriptional regulator [Clostridia bacterium]|nr:Lrp/AsnC family transcriptional regulator [Clostridia bacterium]
MLDETDVFLINACISNASYEVIAHAMGYSMAELKNRLQTLSLKGINARPGMGGKKITPQDVKIYNLLKSGKSDIQIVAQLGLQGKYKVANVIKKFESLGKDNSKKDEPSQNDIRSILSKEDQVKIVEMKNQGRTIAEIAEYLDTDFHSFEHRIGVTVKSGHAIPELVQMWIGKGTWHRGKIESIKLDETDRQILERRDKQTLRETAKELGLDFKTVKNKNRRMRKYPIEEQEEEER